MNRHFFWLYLIQTLGARFSLDDFDHDKTLDNKDNLDKETEWEALAALAERKTQESQNPSFL